MGIRDAEEPIFTTRQVCQKVDLDGSKVACRVESWSLSSGLRAINTIAGHQDKVHASEINLLSFEFVLDRHLHQLISTSKMRISNAPELVKKAAAAVKSKTGALRAKLLFLASLRRRMAMGGAVSRRIHALVSSPDGRERQARVEYGGQALALRKALAAAAAAAEVDEPAGDHGGVVLDLYEAAMFDEEDHGYPDWTQSLFDDDNCFDVEDEEEDGHDQHDFHDVAADDETSVVEIIRSNREVEGLEFNMEDDIDEACDMFIRRFRSRMNRSI
ncbi:hypothetical protein ACP70R_007137 [Stipagrostis hirtigluma subsp. patula]